MNINVLIWREEGYYIIRSPDVGTTAQGKSLQEAIARFKEAFLLSMEDPDFMRFAESKLRDSSTRVSIAFGLSIPKSISNDQTSGSLWKASNQGAF